VYLCTAAPCVPLHRSAVCTSAPQRRVYLCTAAPCVPLHRSAVCTSAPQRRVYLSALRDSHVSHPPTRPQQYNGVHFRSSNPLRRPLVTEFESRSIPEHCASSFTGKDALKNKSIVSASAGIVVLPPGPDPSIPAPAALKTGRGWSEHLFILCCVFHYGYFSAASFRHFQHGYMTNQPTRLFS